MKRKREREIKRQACSLMFSLFFFTAAVAQRADTTLLVFFDVDKASTDSLQLRNLGRFLKAIGDIKKVIGYADTTGTTSYNLKLSQSRAKYISSVLREKYRYRRPFLLRFRGEDDQRRELWLNRKVEIIASLKDTVDVFPSNDSSITNGTKIIGTINQENILFLPDKAIISEESLPYVEELAKTLKGYGKKRFEIVGHVNYQSKLDSSHLRDLFALSRERARVICDLLMENGIPKERLLYKGVGNSEPLFKNPKNEIEKRKNMRVEVNILE